jgi:hypothetical protein
LVAIDRSTGRVAASSSGDLEPGVPAADHQHRPRRQRLGVAVVGAVELGHRAVQLAGHRGDEGDLERSGGHHHLAGPVAGFAGADLEAFPDLPELGDLGVEPDRQVEGSCVGLQVVGHRVLGRVGVGRSRERHARQGVILGRREQLQRVPPGPPDLPQLRGGLQDHEPPALLGKVPGHRQPGLAAPDHHHI